MEATFFTLNENKKALLGIETFACDYKVHINEGKLTVSEICERLDISRATYYNYISFRGLSGKLRPYKK